VLHDDSQREYVYGPSQNLPDLYDAAKGERLDPDQYEERNWKWIFAWEK
jgi:hypothetical protein